MGWNQEMNAKGLYFLLYSIAPRVREN